MRSDRRLYISRLPWLDRHGTSYNPVVSQRCVGRDLGMVDEQPVPPALAVGLPLVVRCLDGI
jgi:hypothetical protein